MKESTEYTVYGVLYNVLSDCSINLQVAEELHLSFRLENDQANFEKDSIEESRLVFPLGLVNSMKRNPTEA